MRSPPTRWLVIPMSSDQSETGTDRAVAELGATKLAVRIDGEWCPEQLWYTPDLPVFIAADGSEVDIRDDGSILYETPDGTVQEIEEPEYETERLSAYSPRSIYPADKIEVHRLDRPWRSEPADFGHGESTGVQSL